MQHTIAFRHRFLGALTTLTFLFVGTGATPLGGFHLRADYSPNDDAAFTVRATGCHEPAKASVSGTAEGIVDGKRVSKKLALKSTGKGVYDVMWDGSSEGTWVLAISGSYLGRDASLLVNVQPDGTVRLPEPDRYGYRFSPMLRALTSSDIDAALSKLASAG